MADYRLWNALKDAKKYLWVELSHALNNESHYWSGIPEGSVELAKTVWDWRSEERRVGKECRSRWSPYH